MHDGFDRILIDRRTIADRVDALGAQLDTDLHTVLDSPSPKLSPSPDAVTLIAIMTGSLVFLADLIRRLTVPLRILPVTVRSYPGSATTSQGPQLLTPLPDDLARRHVVLVDDILDSGRTLRLVRGLIEQQRPASLRLCVLLRKTIPSAQAIPADYVGFDIPDRFVVGYGLDFNGLYRNLPDIVTLKPAALTADADHKDPA